MIRFDADDVHFDVDRPRGLLELFADLVGIFRIRLDDRVLYEEPEFCVVEFAYHVARWLSANEHDEYSELTYESMEAEDPLVCFRRANGGWLVGAAHEEYHMTEPVPLDVLRQACRHHQARWHSPVLGRMLQPGGFVPDAANPQDPDRYGYAADGPLRYVEPAGHAPSVSPPEAPRHER